MIRNEWRRERKNILSKENSEQSLKWLLEISDAK